MNDGWLSQAAPSGMTKAEMGTVLAKKWLERFLELNADIAIDVKDLTSGLSLAALASQGTQGPADPFAIYGRVLDWLAKLPQRVYYIFGSFSSPCQAAPTPLWKTWAMCCNAGQAGEA